VIEKIVLDLADDNGQSGGLPHTRGNLNYVTKITPVRRCLNEGTMWEDANTIHFK
jgi:hypothetical protein